MNSLEKYLDHVIERRPANVGGTPVYNIPPSGNPEIPPESDSGDTYNLVAGILRRWHIVLLVVLVICGVGLPVIWLSIEPVYNVTGAIKVEQILSNILTGEADRGEISNYQSFMYTQAEMISKGRVVQRVADDLADKNLSFFSGEPINFLGKIKRKLSKTKGESDPASVLRQAITNGQIIVAPVRTSELIEITMKSTNPQEAKQIVDAFISTYMAVEVSSSAESQDHELGVLENERGVLAEKLQSQRRAIGQLAQEYGTTTLGGRQDMMLQRVTTLLAELTRLEARRINLEAQVQFFEQTKKQTIAPEELLRMRNEYVNSDPTVRELSRNIIELDKDLIIAKQRLVPTNPALKEKQELLNAFQSRLQEKREEVAKSFDDMASQQTNQVGREKLLSTQAELEQSKVYEERLRNVLNKEDTQTIELGRKQLQIQDLQFQLALDQEIYDTVRRRLRELEMERKRPARISVAYNAEIGPIQDKRKKYSAALLFGALVCGVMLASLRDKVDQSLWTPDDVARRIGIRIIGTTASSQTIEPALLTEQIAGDYQTIRTNLGLLDNEGMPKKLAVTSPGMGEGKTTFAINLATSMSRSGKKVLLIDGDLRKPDIAYLLNLPDTSKGLKDVLTGGEFEQAICSVPSSSLDVLTAGSRNGNDAYELLASPKAAQQINKLSRNYDHLIIDTPPVLVFPDALVWARIADAVILTSFAGQTTAPDLKEAKKRLTQINARVLGSVMSNVRTTHSYQRYGYYSQGSKSGRSTKQDKIRLLLPSWKREKDTHNSNS